MTSKEASERLSTYESALCEIRDRFVRSREGIHIAEGDQADLHQMVLELADFVQDALEENGYRVMLIDAFNEGVRNFFNSSSYASVERIISIVRAIITRIETNPRLVKGPQPATMQPDPSSAQKRRTLAKLVELRAVRELETGFPEKRSGLSWAAQVEGLLDFNPQYRFRFSQKLQLLHSPLSSATSTALFDELISILETAITQLTNELDAGHLSAVKLASPAGDYVHQERIAQLRAINNASFDLTRLIQMCNELNSNHQSANVISIAMLCRAIIDHVPPLFGGKTFSDVVSQYAGGGRSFRESMEHLQTSSRKIGDQNLHAQIRKSEVLPTITQVDFSNDLDVLLGEIVRILK